MDVLIISAELATEADRLAKETGLAFRDCLEILVEQQRGQERVRGLS